MQLSRHFSLAEFQASQTAKDAGIDNRLPDLLLNNAKATAEMLERIRAALSAFRGREIAVHLSSGYRCLTLNRRLKSSDSSDHVSAMAADLTAPAFGSPIEICSLLEPQVDALGIGQLIHEFGRWVHVSTRVPEKAVNRIITIDNLGTRAGILEAR